jgi:hypothetical protein
VPVLRGSDVGNTFQTLSMPLSTRQKWEKPIVNNGLLGKMAEMMKSSNASVLSSVVASS